MKHKTLNLPLRISIIIMIIVVILLASISALFVYTENITRSESIKHIETINSGVSSDIDDTVLNIYSVSDTFAYSGSVYDYTLKNANQDSLKKRSTTVHISNALFPSLDMLRNNEKMAAYYNNTTHELFDFLDPNADLTVADKFLNNLDIHNNANLSRFVWHPVCDNLLRSDKTGNIRHDKAIIGSRRVFSSSKNMYTGIHVFAISEEIIYNKYKDMYAQYNPNVYVLTDNCQLLSSSDEKTLSVGAIDDKLCDALLNRKYDRFTYDGSIIFVKKSNVSGWLTVVQVKESNLFSTISKLYRPILIMLICFAICAIIILLLFYRTYMRPISLLDKAMMRVRNGDINAYIDYKSKNEFGEMIDCYNNMLRSINHNMIEKLNTEGHKKELELEILMNQINPHFLYNTLETIIWKAADAGRPDIGQIAAALGRMYRLSISGGKLFVSLQHELEHVNAYIKIQESRYENRFTFETVYKDEDLHETYTLKMLLQPIVENSLSHALDGLDRQLHIRLTIRLDDKLHIRVTDTGLGMNAERLKAVQNQIINGINEEQKESTPRKKSTGIGLHNVYERLNIYYKEDATMRIWSKEDFGTIVDLTLPIKTNE